MGGVKVQILCSSAGCSHSELTPTWQEMRWIRVKDRRSNCLQCKMMVPASPFGNCVRGLIYVVTKEHQPDSNSGQAIVKDQETIHLKQVCFYNNNNDNNNSHTENNYGSCSTTSTSKSRHEKNYPNSIGIQGTGDAAPGKKMQPRRPKKTTRGRVDG
jgi:hypothetical protein